jgi:ABC-type lipoprotein export system ATPase subunit
LAFFRALTSPGRDLNEARLILADELTGNLVPEGEKALLLVTHNPAIAEACDWIHEMKDGRIIASHPQGTRSSISK